MIDIKLESSRVETLRLQQMGEDWIQAISEEALDRLEAFIQPNLTGTLLLPKRMATLTSLEDLLANYHDWFDEATNFQVEASRVAMVGRKLGIFYRFRLQKPTGWYTIEQQLYCILRDGLVEKVHLLCSGFQPIETSYQFMLENAQVAGEPDPVRDELLEFHSGAPDSAATCALLTPAIRSKLNEMETGQVLEVHVDDPTARGDIEAWSRLSGNTLLKVVADEGPILRFFLKKK